MLLHEGHQNAVQRGAHRGRLNEEGVAIFTGVEHPPDRRHVSLDASEPAGNLRPIGIREISGSRLGMSHGGQSARCRQTLLHDEMLSPWGGYVKAFPATNSAVEETNRLPEDAVDVGKTGGSEEGAMRAAAVVSVANGSPSLTAAPAWVIA